MPRNSLRQQHEDHSGSETLVGLNAGLTSTRFPLGPWQQTSCTLMLRPNWIDGGTHQKEEMLRRDGWRKIWKKSSFISRLYAADRWMEGLYLGVATRRVLFLVFRNVFRRKPKSGWHPKIARNFGVCFQPRVLVPSWGLTPRRLRGYEARLLPYCLFPFFRGLMLTSFSHFPNPNSAKGRWREGINIGIGIGRQAVGQIQIQEKSG